MYLDYHQLLLDWVQEPIGKKDKRALRKERRKHKFFEAYLRLVKDCEPILSPYYDHPTHIINRFWAERDIINMLCYEDYPSVSDFISWFCDSETIRREKMQGW